jgi:hypothetical protein
MIRVVIVIILVTWDDFQRLYLRPPLPPPHTRTLYFRTKFKYSFKTKEKLEGLNLLIFYLQYEK